jgi:hypothetical protein
MYLRYSELTDQEKRIWDTVYANSYSKNPDAYNAMSDADQSIYDLRYEKKQRR